MTIGVVLRLGVEAALRIGVTRTVLMLRPHAPGERPQTRTAAVGLLQAAAVARLRGPRVPFIQGEKDGSSCLPTSGCAVRSTSSER